MYNLYHIALDDNVILEVPAESQKEALRKALYPTNVVDIRVMPITKGVQLDETELEYSHAIGDITYIVHHMVDDDGCYYELSLGQATERQDDIDYDSVVDIRIKLEAPMDFAYGTMDEVKKAIQKAINEANDIYNYAMGY